MPKNIVLCSDGTGNAGGKTRGTNVWRLFKALDLDPPEQDSDRPQIAFYDDGVGTEDFKLFKILGGALGWGLSSNVRQLYENLARAYEPGDQIYLFGFSRGAFTARTLAGFICACGIVDKRDPKSGALLGDRELKRRVGLAYKAYRASYQASLQKAISMLRLARRKSRKPAGQFKLEYAVQDKRGAPGGDVPIAFVGVWDTVDAVGLPFNELAKTLNTVIYQFKFGDKVLNPLVRKACHAIAIDDERQTFHPLLWDEASEKPARGEAKRIEQVWFAGVHSNVGGGYPKDEMAHAPLVWMMRKAQSEELRFRAGKLSDYRAEANPHGKMYDSRSGPAAYYRYLPRDVSKLCRNNDLRPVLHASVLERIGGGQTSYAPAAPLRVADYDVEDATPATPVEHRPGERVELAERAWHVIRMRQRLYKALLLTTWLLFMSRFVLPADGSAMGTPGGEVVGSAMGVLDSEVVGAAIEFAKSLVPSILEGWIERFKNNPVWLLAFAAAFGLLLRTRKKLKARTEAAGELAWREGFGGGNGS